MAHHNKVSSIRLKYLLTLIAAAFAVAAALLIILFTSAATATGSTPELAISMTTDVSTGILGPDEQRWFRIVPKAQGQAVEQNKTLTLVFSAPSADLAQYVSMQIFTQAQIRSFDANSTGQMPGLGAGQLINGNTPGAGQLVWSGPLMSNKTYYVMVTNNSDHALDYWLSTENAGAENVDTQARPGAQQPAEIAPRPVAAVPEERGTAAANAAPLAAGLNRGSLAPHATYWYTFSYNDFSDGKKFQDLNFSLFFTPDNGNRRHHVNFELFTARAIEAWQHGDEDSLNNFGAGMLVSRDGDFNTGERIWQGTVLKGDTYFLAVKNGADVPIDFWLFDDDIYNPEFGPKPNPTPLPTFAEGAAPQASIPLVAQKNTGGLEPGQEIWYSFSVNDDNDREYFKEVDLTFIFTPDDGNRIWNVNVDIFTADSVRNWSPGDNSNINNVGAGSVVYRDNNAQTGERFWSGWVVENDLYYVQIRNGTTVPIDYWLFTGDVYGPELGK